MQTPNERNWPEPVQRVSAVLRAAAVDARIEEFAGGTPSAREAARAVGCELAQIVKSLVLVCDGAYVLALVPGDGRADEGGDRTQARGIRGSHRAARRGGARDGLRARRASPRSLSAR